MKKIKYLLLVLLSIIIFPNMVNASSGKISISGTNTVVVGNKVTVTVNLSSNSLIGSWQMQLNYDKNYLQLTSTDAENNGVRMANSSAGIKSKKYTYTFKTLKTGSTNISMSSYLVYAFEDMSEMSISAGSKTIKIITQQELEASYSKDNNLKSLSVEGYVLDKEFNKDTLEYSVTVPEGTTSIKINAIANDSKSSVTGHGEVSVSEGINNLKIIVKAENGSEKTYNLVVNVIDENPINIDIDNVKYSIVKLRSNYTCPELFTESEVTINDINIPSCYNEIINYTLVGLKKDDGKVESFIYNNGKYEKYNEVVGTYFKIIILDYNGEIKGLNKTTAVINDNTYQVFKFQDSSNYFVVYGINIESGKKDFFTYDNINKTFSLYNREHIDYLMNQNKIYLYIIIAFGICLFLAFICIIMLCKKKSKKKIVKDKKKIINEKEENIILEKDDNSIEEDTNDLFDRKKKNKKEKQDK